MADACVRTNQRLLAKLGFDPGPIDGVRGRRTRLALSEALGKQAIPDRDTDDGGWAGGTAWPKQTTAAMTAFYGAPGTNHTRLTVPYPLRIAWDLRKTVNRMTINKKCAASASRVLKAVLAHYGHDEIKRLKLDVWGGCYNNRNMRGGTRLSTHAFACAIDWDPTRNQLRWNKSRAKLASPEYNKWWECWEAEGWVSLGRARNFDWMHIQAARL